MGGAQALAAEHPVLENSVPGSVPDMLARLSEGIPVEGMEALLPLLRPSDFATLPDHLPEGTPLLVCDPEKVRTRAADLIKTGREFLEASWSVAAIGGDAPIDIEALGGSALNTRVAVLGATVATLLGLWAFLAFTPYGRILRAGMVTTIEPGIYVRPAPGVPEAFHHIGIRIEDDAVVTDTGCELITRGVPVEVAEIEALMRD